MRWCRPLLLPLVVGVGILAAGALGQQSSPPPPQPTGTAKPAPSPPKPPISDPAATKTLEEAIQAKRLDWIETTLWQQVDVQGLTFQAEGTYLSAPDNRLHLNLVVHVGGTTGRLEVISDGTTLWETTQIGDGERTVTKKVRLKDILESLNKPEVAKEMRDEFLESQSFYGVLPLLQSIQQRMVMTKKENLTWRGLNVMVLTAEWNNDVAKVLTQDGKQPWPHFLPRRCRLFLDAKTLWPHRVKWVGPTPAGEDSVIVQMEFRNPKHEPLPPEACKREFSFNPGKDLPSQIDQTDELKNTLSRRNQQLTAQRGETAPKK